jgi:hypothetical protein
MIAGSPILETGLAHVRAIQETGGAVLGVRDLALDGIHTPDDLRNYWGYGYPAARARVRLV